MTQSTSSKNNDDTTQLVKISVNTEYLEQHSQPDQQRYVFAYHISIENCGNETITLLRRHWIITDSNDKTQEVSGEGVVGEQPTLAPGDVYQYSSGSLFETPVGFMQGHYQIMTDTNECFDATIPLFRLAVPNSLH